MISKDALKLNLIKNNLEHRLLILAVIIPERILVDVGLQVLGTDRMIDAGYATLHQRPETLNAVRVDAPTSILPVVVADSKVGETEPRHGIVAGELVGVEDCTPVNLPENVGDNGVPFYIGDNACHHLPVSLGDADDLALALSATPTLALPLSADVGFVSLYLANESGEVLLKEHPDLPEHSPGRLVGDTRFPLDLLGGYSTSGGSHLVDCLKPNPERGSGLVEDSAGGGVNLVSAVVALVAGTALNPVVLCHPLAYRAVDAVRVAVALNPLKAGIVVGELLVKVFKRVFLHFLIPLIHVLYHNLYVLSRDNYLAI
jgi:hypothetical protein